MEAPEKIYLSDFTDTTEGVFYVKKDNLRIIKHSVKNPFTTIRVV